MCPWPPSCSDAEPELQVHVFPPRWLPHRAGNGREGTDGGLGVGQGVGVGFKLRGSCLPKPCGGKEHFTRPGPLAWKHLFPFKSARRLLPPQNA